ncbi:MAG: M15 family metallopeptidase [Oscillospiraceae bacterium]
MSNRRKKKIKINKKRLTISILVAVAIIAVVIFAIVKAVDGKKAEEKPTTTSEKPSSSTTQEKTTRPTTTPVPVSDPKKFIDAKSIKIDESKWNLTLLNRSYKLPAGYVPKTQKITLSSKDPRQTEKALAQTLDTRVAAEYQKMYDAAAKQGIYLTPYSGYRSIEFQAQIFENYININKKKGYSLEEAKYQASQTVLPPGTSEHNMGIAMDIVNTKNEFEKSEEYKWLDKNAQNFGFILRYPKDKVNVTKIIYEPWHWRYVGVKTAKEMKSSGLCMEEFFAK